MQFVTVTLGITSPTSAPDHERGCHSRCWRQFDTVFGFPKTKAISRGQAEPTTTDHDHNFETVTAGQPAQPHRCFRKKEKDVSKKIFFKKRNNAGNAGYV